MRKIVFILLFLCPILSFAQKEDRVWVFDDSIAIDWNDTLNPIVYQIATTQCLDENYASISDKNGNLLFYIGGDTTEISGYHYSTIFGNNQLKIPNGDSINTNRSITQGLLFLPDLNDTNKYYFIYLALANNFGEDSSLFYGVIDKSVGPFGSCIQKDVLLEHNAFTEKLTAVRHGNGSDWWIITRKYNSNEFHKFLLSSTGISGPFIQSIGPNIAGDQGQMKFSPDGSKLGFVSIWNPKVAVFNFNRCTGVFSNYKNLGNDEAYGCSFSPNNKIFYESTFDKLYQYNLDSPNVALSKFLIWDDSSNSYGIGQHLLAPDGNIYIVSEYYILPNTVFTTKNMNLTVIQNPNVYGIGCNIQPYSFYLNGLRCMGGLPNMVNYNLGPLIGSPCDTISVCSITQSNNSAGICNGEMYDFNGTQLTTSGTYYDTLANAQGCDSLVTLQLNVMNATGSNNYANICNGGSYNFNGSNLTIAGTYYDTLQNAQGCDSLITLQLSVVNPITSNSSASICNGENYNFNGIILTATGIYDDTLQSIQGCDSIVTLQLNVNPATSSGSTLKICDGDSINVGGNIHTVTGIYIDTLTNALGCDSVVTTALEVDTVSATVTVAGDTLTAVESGGGISYQWYNCDSSANISGATSQLFVVTVEGNYAVWITDGQGCSKLSDCVFVDVTGVNQLAVDSWQLAVYPNPAGNQLAISFVNGEWSMVNEIQITDVLGRVVLKQSVTPAAKNVELDVSALSSGVYFVKVFSTQGAVTVKKVVKNN